MRERLPPLPQDQLTDAQRQALQALLKGPRAGAGAGGPFGPMLRSPELTNRVQQVGEYLRWGSRLPGDLRELAILVVARHWSQPVEWFAHAKVGLEEGLTASQINAIGESRRPEGAPAQLAVYDLCVEILETRQVSEETYARLTSLLPDEELVIDLLGACGYYVLLAIIMNTAGTPAPAGAVPFRAP